MVALGWKIEADKNEETTSGQGDAGRNRARGPGDADSSERSPKRGRQDEPPATREPEPSSQRSPLEGDGPSEDDLNDGSGLLSPESGDEEEWETTGDSAALLQKAKAQCEEYRNHNPPDNNMNNSFMKTSTLARWQI